MTTGIVDWRSAVLWGLIGGLSFLVLVQGYELLASERIGPLSKGGIALGVTAGATILARGVGPRIRRRLRQK